MNQIMLPHLTRTISVEGFESHEVLIILKLKFQNSI